MNSTTPGRHATVRRLSSSVVVLALLAQLVLLAMPASVGAAVTVNPGWTATGPNTSIPQTGAGGLAELTYAYNNAAHSGAPLQTWTFSTTVSSGGTLPLTYSYTGLHAWFGVTVSLEAYVTHGVNTTYTALQSGGPTNCCTAPSNGFAYSGTVPLGVQAGDTVGFRLTGSNGDYNSFLNGDLKVGFDIVQNGSFESPVVNLTGPQAYQFPGIHDPLTGWTVPVGQVDLSQPDVWNAADGNQAVDLDGYLPGSLRQTLTTIPGQQYQVTFQYSANPGDGHDGPSTPSASMDVKAGGTTIGSFTHAYGPAPVPEYTPANLSYAVGQVYFVASGATTDLDFVSTDAPSNPWGIVLDNVTVAPVVSSADFAFVTPSPVTLTPGTSTSTPIQTTGGAGATIGLSTSLIPGGQTGVSASAGTSVAGGSAATFTVSAAVDAAPGLYTATVTGTLGGFIHTVTIPIVVTAAVGIPGLVLAVPADLGATDGTFLGSSAGANALYLTGMVNGPANTSYPITLLTSDSCVDGSLGAGATTLQALNVNNSNPITLTANITTAGTAYFGGTIRVGAGTLHNFIAARIGSGAIGPCIVVSSANDQWPYAADITAETAGAGTPVQGFIDVPGRGRWYRFQIVPGTKVTITLSGLSSDDDVFLFHDVEAAYKDLTDGTASLTKLSAEFASADVANAFTSNAFTSKAFPSDADTANAFTSNAFTSNAFTSNAFTSNAFTSNAFTSNAFTSNAFTSNAFTSNAFTSNAFTSNAFTSNAFTSNAFTSDAFTSNAFTSDGQFNPYGVNPDAYSSAQSRTVVAGSAQSGTVTETIDASTFTNTGFFYVRVNGKSGASSASPFSLTVSQGESDCAGVTTFAQPNLGTIPTGIDSLILWDSTRFADSVAADVTSLASNLDALKGRSEVNGDVVDLGDTGFAGHDWIQQLNDQADQNPDCVYAKNLVAYAIKDIVAAYRAANPGLKYVVLAGGDSVIPFFRYPDENSLGPEKDYVPPVDPNSSSNASIESNYVLGQDEYGSTTSLALGTYSFPIPDLPVGRLVEKAADINTVLAGYLDGTADGTGVALPNNGQGGATDYSSLVTGYDFLADAATSVEGQLATGTGTTPDTLIDQPSVGSDTWSGTDLTNALTSSRHDLMFLAGHFSAQQALASDFTTSSSTTDLLNGLAASATDLTNAVVFSAGCHSGYNLVDADQQSVTGDPLDWAQAFAQSGATLIAGTGYQYGDSDLELWSERVYSEFAHQLRTGSGPVAIGNALMRSKQVYLASTPDVAAMDAKALIESAIYGLPMLSVDFPAAGRDTSGSGSSVVGGTTPVGTGPGAGLGLSYFDLSNHATGVSGLHSKTLTTVDPDTLEPNGSTDVSWVSGPDGIAASPGLPVLPLDSVDVTVPGDVLRGVGFRGGTFSDTPGLTPLTAAPSTDFNFAGIQGFTTPTWFPADPWRVNYYDALGSGGQTRLLLTPAQFKSNGTAIGGTTLRAYSHMSVRLFYNSNTDSYDDGVNGTGATYALAAAPSIGDVTAFQTASGIEFQATVPENPAGVQSVWVTYTVLGSTSWQSFDLTELANARGVWTGDLPFGGSIPGVRFMVQAVSGVGLVGRNTNSGNFFNVASAGLSSNQTITFAPLGGKTYGDLPFTIGATASSGLPVTFTSTTPSVCGLEGSSVHILAAGSCTIEASQSGDATTLPADPVDRTFTILKRGLTITAASQTKVYGTVFTFAGTEFTTGAGQLVNGDTVASVTLASTGAPATAIADDSPYPITPSAAVGGPGTNLNNYQISYAPGGLLVVTNPIPTVTAATPASVGRGAISFPVTLTGTGFAPGATVSISGTGVTAGTPTSITLTSITVPISVTTGATLGNRTITVTNKFVATPGTCVNCLNINQGPYGIAAVPLSVGRGAVNETVAVVGFNFTAGTWTPASVLFSGTGITVNSVNRISSILLSVNLSVDPAAPTGARSVTVINPDGGRSTALAAFTVNPAPVVTSFSPSSRGQGATNENLVITGTGFQPGSWSASSVSFSGTGIVVNSVSRTDSMHVSVNVSIAATASTGPRDVALRNGDGGRTTRTGAFTVLQGPSISSISPASRPQGASNQTLIIAGSNFSSSATVAFSGSGITINSVTKTSTQLTVKATISSSAPIGARTVTIKNPDGGTATTTFSVNAKPTISSLSPKTSPRNQTNKTILINGSGFAAGATVTFSGTGITVVSVTVVNGNQLSVKINVASNAPTGNRNVTVTNTDTGTVTQNNGFKIT